MIYNRQTGEIKNLTEGFDRWVGSLYVGAGFAAAVLCGGRQGEAPLYVVPVGGGISDPRSQEDFRFADSSFDGKTMFVTCMSIQAPNEICRSDSI